MTHRIILFAAALAALVVAAGQRPTVAQPAGELQLPQPPGPTFCPAGYRPCGPGCCPA